MGTRVQMSWLKPGLPNSLPGGREPTGQVGQSRQEADAEGDDRAVPHRCRQWRVATDRGPAEQLGLS